MKAYCFQQILSQTVLGLSCKWLACEAKHQTINCRNVLQNRFIFIVAHLSSYYVMLGIELKLSYSNGNVITSKKHLKG